MIALLPHCGFLSETTRMLAIARSLQARGMRIAMATHGGPYTRVLDDAGMPYTLLEPQMDAARCAAYVRGVVALGRPGARLQPPDEVRAGVAAEHAFFRRTGARMAVIGFTLTAYLSSRLAGIPLAASHGGSYVPPVFERRLAPDPVQAPMPQMERLPAFMRRFLANVAPPRLKDPVRFLNDVADEFGIERVPSLAALMLGDLTLVTEVAEVLGVPDEVLRAWRPGRRKAYRAGTRLVYCGPLFARLGQPVPAVLEPWLDGSRATAYVALSSATPELVRAVVTRVREAGLRVIVAGTIHDVTDLAGPDVFVGGILPSERIMPKVDVAVVMGGQGSVQTAMASGTPIVGLPLHPEQELNVAIAVRHGMGLAVAPRRADTTDVSKAVGRTVQEPAFLAQARRVQALYAGVDGADQAAAEILRYLAGNVPDAVTPSPGITPTLAGRSASAERSTIQTGFSGR